MKNQPRVLVCFLALLLTVLSGCGEKGGEETRTLTGIVHTSAGDPVPGARVMLDGKTLALSDQNGRFSFPAVSSGGHTIEASKVGYAPSSKVGLEGEEIILFLDAPPSRSPAAPGSPASPSGNRPRGGFFNRNR